MSPLGYSSFESGEPTGTNPQHYTLIEGERGEVQVLGEGNYVAVIRNGVPVIEKAEDG